MFNLKHNAEMIIETEEIENDDPMFFVSECKIRMDQSEIQPRIKTIKNLIQRYSSTEQIN